MKMYLAGLCLLISIHLCAYADEANRKNLKAGADLIKQTYEEQLYTLPAFKMGHYGLRMYRQTQEDKYTSAIWLDMARLTSLLNRFAMEVYTSEQIRDYVKISSENYTDTDPVRGALRRKSLQKMPEYLYLMYLLGSMSRADEYGLKHREDAKLREVIKRYDFTKYASDPDMIRAWAAQLANQVYWLRQLGEQDVVESFINTFKATYPDSQDDQLTEQEFANKIYGLTHLIFAASEYYQRPINEQDFQWIYDYFRNNIDKIIARSKEDVITETAISFLLAGKETDPVVSKVRVHILNAIDKEQGMIPSRDGRFSFSYGEHRNVLAVMLLDWRGVNTGPNIQLQPNMFRSLPYGLVTK
ncbi:DUF3541 domain-containing protein [Shewanella sp. VB17]|uniref:DUF3541 domain-containing protein n=1 Tax=Shewanella sp. VB17 TaxID=2739432 RepID=UPI001566B681|nr:DUF3541 domain-containing protein [Shewanella sp. VB17]NRD73928.1 DUF3541 domain-containing protein [Shewanella sp. VB17]